MKENLFDWTHDMQPKPDLEAIEVTLRALLSAAASMASDDNKKQQSATSQAAVPDHVEADQAGPAHFDKAGPAHFDQAGPAHFDQAGPAHFDQAYDDHDDDEAVVMVPNYPDLVPRPNPAAAPLLLLKGATTAIATQERPLKASDPAAIPRQTPTPTTTTAAGPLSETMFLLALLFGTCFLLYIFPAGSWIHFLLHTTLGVQVRNMKMVFNFSTLGVRSGNEH